MTGRRANFADGDNPVPNNDFYPSIGSVAAHFLLENNGYVLINFRGYTVEMNRAPATAFATALTLTK